MRYLKINEIDFSKFNGLIPVIAQSSINKEILMLAFANKTAVKMTIKTGYAHYWSRSRNIIWKKGEKSGNLQHIESIFVDCDADSLIYKVIQKGVACHTGSESCFFRLIKN